MRLDSVGGGQGGEARCRGRERQRHQGQQRQDTENRGDGAGGRDQRLAFFVALGAAGESSGGARGGACR